MKALFWVKVKWVEGVTVLVMVTGGIAAIGVQRLLAEEPVAPAAPAGGREFKVKKDHPRIWVTPERLARLKELQKRNTPEWQSLKTSADLLLTKEVPTGIHVPSLAVYDLAMMHLMTKDSAPADAGKYATKALEIMHWYFDKEAIKAIYGGYDPKTQPPFPNYGGYAPGYVVRSIVPPLAVGYDWLYDRLSPQEKSAFAAKLQEWRDWYTVYGAGNSGFPGGINNWNTNYACSEMLTGLATFGDNPRAVECVNHAVDDYYGKCFKPAMERGAKRGYPVDHFNYGKNEKKVAPDYPAYALQSGAKGGFPTESTSYGPESLAKILMTFEALKTATGKDYFRDCAYFEDAGRYMLNMTLPGLVGVFPYGEMSVQATGGGLNDRESNAMAVLVNNSPGLRGVIERWLRRGIGSLSHAHPALGFLWYDPDTPEAAFDTLPTDYLVEGNHFIFSRSDWGPDATWVSFQAGDNFGGRPGSNDYGHFTIYRKGWLIPESGGTAVGSNCRCVFLIGGEGQKSRCYRPATKLIRYETTPDSLYAETDLANAYWDDRGTPTSHPLESYSRTFVFLKPDTVVVLDRLTSTEGSVQLTKEALSQYPFTEPTVDGNLISGTSDKGGSKVFQKVLLPEKAVISKVNLKFKQSLCNIDWTVKVSPPAPQKEDLFLSVFQAADANVAQMASTTRLEGREKTAVGVQVGNRVVLFGRTGQIDGALTYKLDATGASKQLILNLRPTCVYEIKDNDKPLATLTSSGQGSMSFEVTPGTFHTIEIVPKQ